MDHTRKINSLNGIRGFAVLLVLLAHASYSGLNIHPNLNFTGAGRYGVFLFFVLSAFLLTRQFITAKQKRKNMRQFIGHYFLKRFLRIYPLLTFALLTYYLLIKIGYNIYYIDGVIFFKTLFLLDGPGIFWTIPVEFQYYFFLPAIALLLTLVNPPYINKHLFVIATSILFSFCWWYFFPPKYTANLLPFLPIFLFGTISAFTSFYIKNSTPLSNIAHILNILAIATLIIFILIIPYYYNLLFNTNIGRTHFHENFLFLSMLSCFLILLTIHSNGIVKKIFESRFFVFWGNISFSAYLGHMIILKLAIPSLGKGYPIEIKWLMFFVLTAAFSYVSFKYIELPLSKHQTITRLYAKIGNKKI